MADTAWKPPPDGKRFDWHAASLKNDVSDVDVVTLDAQSQLDYGRDLVTGPIATHLGYWRQCRFPVCRRGRACRAQNPPNHRDGLFPPCVHGNSEMRNAISSMGSVIARTPDLFEKVFRARKPAAKPGR